MTPFQQLRVWARHATIAQRAMTATAAIIVVVLVAVLVTPVDHKSDTDTLQAGNSHTTVTTGLSTDVLQPGDGSSTATTVGASGIGSVGGPSATTAPTAAVKQCPATVDQGVTADSIKIAITVINIGGAAGNDSIDVPSPAQQQQDWQYLADSINASGGAACRKLELSFFQVNPVDPNAAQTQCLAMANAKPFLALDSGALTGGQGSADCIAQQKIPLVSTYLGDAQLKKYYPYYISAGDIVNNVIRNGILGLNQGGYFSAAKGFKKLGVLLYTCQPGPPAAMRKALQDAGLSSGQLVFYDIGCPPGGTYTAASYEQAVLAFKNANATHVTYAGSASFGDFTKAASAQNYKPQYLLADSAVPSAAGTKSATPANLDGAIDATGGRYAEEGTPGFAPDAGTAKCNAIFAAKGQPTVYRQGVGYGGVVCHYMWFVQALLNNAPQLRRDMLVSGMHSIGYFDGSFPFGPVNFGLAPAGASYGLNGWRIVTYSKGCGCWNVADRTFRPAFQ